MNNAPSLQLTVVAQVFSPQVNGSTILLANLLQHYSGQVHAIGGSLEPLVNGWFSGLAFTGEI